jgi:hypothetical protein
VVGVFPAKAAWSAAKVFELDDFDEDCDGIVDEVGGGVGVGVVVLESAAGLGLTRLREPMAQIEGGKRRGLQ